MNHPFDVGTTIEPKLYDNVYSKFFIGKKMDNVNWSAGVGLKSPVKYNTQVFGGVNFNGHNSVSPLKIGCDLGVRTELNNGNKLEIEYNRSSFSSYAEEIAMVSVNPFAYDGKKKYYPFKIALSFAPQGSWMNPTTSLYVGTNFEL